MHIKIIHSLGDNLKKTDFWRPSWILDPYICQTGSRIRGDFEYVQTDTQ